jgi:uncharacterized protein DUF2568
MALLKGANLALAFLLELIMLTVFAYWGFQTGTETLVKIILGFGAPVLAAAFWGVFLAPRAMRRVGRKLRVLLEVVIFGLGALALTAVGQSTLAVIFAVVVVINQFLLYIWKQ